MVTYVSPQSNTLFSVGEVISANHFALDKSFVDIDELHDFCELVYVEQGEIDEYCDNSVVRLQGGDVLFHRPKESHYTKCISSKATLYYISFKCTSQAMDMLYDDKTQVSASMIDFIHKVYYEFSASVIMNSEGNTLMPTLIDDGPIGGLQLARLYLEALLIEVFRVKSKNNVVFRSRDEYYRSIINRIDKALTDNIYGNISLCDLCSKLHFSKSFICGLYRRETGNTIKQKYNELKIKEAKRLLKSTNYTIIEIAANLCFVDQYYFSHIFKKIVGCSPTEYRKVKK